MNKIILLISFIVFIIILSITTGIIKCQLSTNTLRHKGIQIPMIYIDMINYYVAAVFIVVLSASIGPYIIENLTNMTITQPDSMSASDATYYTLQALIAVVIGKFLANK